MSSLALAADLAKLSCSEESEAMTKFWETSELVERLFPFLDASSTLSLARAHPPSVRILQGGANWAQFIRRSCPSPVINYKSKPENLHDHEWAIEAAELKKEEMRPVVQLLKMMKTPRSYLLDLLDLICERFGGVESFQDRFGAAIVMSCPRHTTSTSHTVDAVGFLLLEQVEAAMGSSEQRLEWLQISQMVGDLTSAFRARVLRQEGVMSEIRAYNFYCCDQNHAEHLLTLVQSCKSLELETVLVFGAIGARGWAFLAEAISLLQDDLPTISVASRQVLLEGEKEDLRRIWDTIPLGGHWSVQVDRDGAAEPGLIIYKGMFINTGLETDEERVMEEFDPEKAWAVVEKFLDQS